MRLPPPRLEDFKQDIELSSEQRLAVLRWAAQWAGHPAYPVRELLPELAARFAGAIGRRDGSLAETILRVAGHHIASERDLNSLLRVAPAFPYAMLRIVEGPYEKCEAARSRAGKVIRSKNAVSLPLDDCDALHCSCWWAFFTQYQMDRGEIAP